MSLHTHILTGERAITVADPITHTHKHSERDLPLHNMSTYADMSWDVTNWIIYYLSHT